ncbi:MAG: dienelactone hydrolase family protein [bacterium]
MVRFTKTNYWLILTMPVFFISLAFGTAKISTSEVSYKSREETVKAFLAVPEGKGPFPAMVVIHEWWGLND